MPLAPKTMLFIDVGNLRTSTDTNHRCMLDDNPTLQGLGADGKTDIDIVSRCEVVYLL
jgi:hypothetical protein